MIAVLLLVGVVTFLVWHLFQVKEKEGEHLPPGPRFRLPVIGQALYLGRNPLAGLRKLREQYGDIFTLQIGPFKGIYVSSLEMVEEIFGRDDFSARIDANYDFKEDINSQIRGCNPAPGIIISSGKVWKEQRRFALRHLRDFGFGKASLQSVIMEEFQDFANDIRQQSDKNGFETEVNLLFNNMTVSVIWRIVTGKRITRKQTDENKIFVKLQKFMQSFGINNVLMLLSLKYIPGRFRSYDPFMGKLKNLMRELFEEFDKEKEEHEKTYDESEMRDFTDIYIRECRRAKKENDTESTFYDEKGAHNFRNVLFDLFFAGSETTSTSMVFTVHYCLHHPGITKKLQAEIDSVIGRDRMPQAEDREKMPYMEAFISEVQRHGCLTPLSVPHAAVHDTEFRGFKIKRNTPVNANLYEIMRDPKNFENPDKFNPERFLDPVTGKYHAPRGYVPFSVGKRECLGRPLAKMELYFFTTALLQQFNLEPASTGLPGLDDINIGIVRSPRKFSARFVPRD